MLVIAGSDSSGGAGIAADIAAVCRLGARPLPVLTAVTAQTSRAGLLAHQPVPADLIEAQFAAACAECAPAPASAKVGMLADADSIKVLARLLSEAVQPARMRIVDPVCGPSRGRGWATDAWLRAFGREMPTACDLITPNLAEARFLAGLGETAAAAEAAAALLAAGFARVLITDAQPEDRLRVVDSFFSSNPAEDFTLVGERVPESASVRGTGCTLSSAIAASVGAHPGAARIVLAEEITVGKMQAASLCRGQAGEEVGRFLPQATFSRSAQTGAGFRSLDEPLGVCPITDDPAVIGEYADQGFTSAQLRIKDKPEDQVAAALAAAVAAGGGRLRLFANDHWQAAAATAGVYGVHLGQEDIDRADLKLLAAKKLRLGVSAHGFFELARARTLQPSYVSLGPVFEPNSKNLPALGTARLQQLLAAPGIPAAVAIGGIGPGQISGLRRLGVGGVACIKAAAGPDQAAALLAAWNRAG